MHTDGIHLHYFVLPGFDLLTRTLGLVGLRLRSQKRISFRVLLQNSNGSIKEEFWQDKSSEDEKLVKMGNVSAKKDLSAHLKVCNIRHSTTGIDFKIYTLYIEDLIFFRKLCGFVTNELLLEGAGV